jgi:hypothetical protein
VHGKFTSFYNICKKNIICNGQKNTYLRGKSAAWLIFVLYLGRSLTKMSSIKNFKGINVKYCVTCFLSSEKAILFSKSFYTRLLIKILFHYNFAPNTLLIVFEYIPIARRGLSRPSKTCTQLWTIIVKITVLYNKVGQLNTFGVILIPRH